MLLDHYGHKVRSENTHWKAKYHCISGLQIDWIGFYRTRKDVFFKMGPSRPHFHYFCLFNIVDSKMFNTIFLPMTGFELWTSGIGSDRSTNWATTTAHVMWYLGECSLPFLSFVLWTILPTDSVYFHFAFKRHNYAKALRLFNSAAMNKQLKNRFVLLQETLRIITSILGILTIEIYNRNGTLQ